MGQHPRPHGPPNRGRTRIVGNGNSATSFRDPAGARTRTRKFLPHTLRTREQWREGRGRDGGGGDREASAGTESDPREGDTAFRSLFLSRSEAESTSRRGGGRGKNKQPKREEAVEAGSRRKRGKSSPRKGQRAESSKERTRRGCGTAPGRAEEGGSLGSRQNPPAPKGAGAPGSRARGPHCPPRSLRPQEPRWAALRRHRPAGGGRGKCEAPKRRRGAELTFLAPLAPALRGAGVPGGRSGPRAPHIAPPARGRAGRAGLRAAPCAAGVCPSLAARAGPSSRFRAQANGAPSPPTRRAASPPRVAAGAGGREGLGGLSPPASQPRLSRRSPAGGALTPRGNPTRGPAPPRKTFVASSQDCAPFVRLSTPP